jgi:D-inositol-3-phosphate glycosyltransferase
VRILHVSANFRPSVGGIERYVELLGRGLVGRGMEVTVLCCRYGDAPRVEEDEGMRIVRVPASYALKRFSNLHYPLPSPVGLLRELRRLVSWADVVHAHDALYLTSAAALRLARRGTTPSVLTQHVSFTPQGSRGLDTAERATIATVGRCARLASQVVAYNAAVAAWAESTWGLAPIPVLPPGVPEPEAELAPNDRAAFRNELSLPEDRFLALFVGRDVATKRLDLFLAASDPAYELVAVTDRPGPTTRSGVRLLPFMAPERLQRLLLAADAFVLPSKAEGFPLSLQEALLAGLPCVVTRVPGFDRYLGADEVWWIEPSAESIRAALRRLATEPETRSALAAKAKAAGRREFGLDRFVEAHLELYSRVVADARTLSRRSYARVSG